MKLKLTWLLTLFMAFVMQLSFGQEKDITGTITTASDGLPLPGVTVIVKGTTRGTQTDFDGKYSIKANTGDVLVFSYVSMKKTERSVGTSNSIDVSMEDDVAALDEIVVTAYGGVTTRAKSMTAASEVKSEGIQNRPNVNVLESLQGQAAGVNIALSSGQPGTNKVDVVIRGSASLLSSSEPLYVIDGVPLTQAFFRNLNPNEIENVVVLKDAAGTAIYGNRGSNGVIVITTKKGQFNESFSVGYSASYGFTDFIEDDFGLPSAQEHLQLQRQGFEQGSTGLASALANSGSFLGGAVTVDPNNLQAFDINTNWRDEFFRQGVTQSHDLNFTAGGEKFRSFTSLGYFQQDGIIPTSDFKRFTGRTNFGGKSLDEKFNYGINVFGAYSRRQQLEQETRGGINNNVLQNPLTGYINSPAFVSPSLFQNSQQLLDDFGSPALNLTPLMLLALFEENAAPSFFEEIKTIVTMNASYDITDNITFGITTGMDYAAENRVFAIGPEAYLSLVRAQGNGQPFDGIETNSSGREFTFNHVNKLSYNNTFNEKHTLDVGVYTEYLRAHFRSNNFRQRGLNPLTWSPGAGTGYIPFNPATDPVAFRPVVGANKIDAGLFSFFGTAEYDYDSKYGFSATIRRDASYRFTDDNQWGTFWSVAGRWNITEEDFVGTSDVLNELKLRASYGSTGNQNIVARNIDSGLSEIFIANDASRDLLSSQTGYNNAASFGIANFGNSDLRWETTFQLNIGLDFRMFKNRLSGTVEYYNRLTQDLYQNLPLTAANGITGLPSNDSELRNRGFEANLRYSLVDNNDFKLNVFGNIGYNVDQFTDVGIIDDDGDGQVLLGNTIRRNGSGLVEYFLVPYRGVNPANGNLLFEDINGNLTEAPTDADRRATNKSLLPTFQGGFGFDMDYKGFFLNTLFTFVGDVYKFDNDLAGLSDIRNATNFPVTTDLFNAWTPDNRFTDVPSLSSTNNLDAQDISDRWLRDASFIRLRNVTLGYSFPQRLLENSLFTNVTVRVIAENYFTFTNWRGFDPVALTNVSNIFPTPKILTFGIDVNF